ncbi:MAG: family hydrolase [Pseudonocardiales bacterium]|nr:family hydrolase [Pseudonocardiales bacterium]
MSDVIELAVFDMAGTTVQEHQVVYRVLEECVVAAGGRPSKADIEKWMGAGKREAITALLTDPVPPEEKVVDAAFADFRSRLDAAYSADPPTAFPAVDTLFHRLRTQGIKIALTTGFDREVTDMLLKSLSWEDQVVDAVVCIDDVTAGRPAPYLIFHAMEATEVRDVRRVLVVGDTVRDVEAGTNAGAAVVVGVTTGDVDADALAVAGPTHVLTDLAGIIDLLADMGQRI